MSDCTSCSDQCSTPITIPTGNAGNDGADGADGVFGGFSSDWVFSASTSTGPSSTEVRLNNATPASVTNIYVADNNADSIDMNAFLTSFTNGSAFGQIRLFKKDDKTKFWIGTVTSVTDNTTDFTLGVTHIQSNSTFSAADAIVISFAPAGADGAAGSNGSAGAAGTNGVTVLHNDLTTHTRNTASYGNVATYTMLAGTVSTDGSKIKIKALLDKASTVGVDSNVQIYVNGVAGHSGIGGTTSNFRFPSACDTMVIEYTLHRVSNTSAACDYTSDAITNYQTRHNYTSFENTVSIGVIDFDAANLTFAIRIQGNGIDNVNLKGFSVEHYIK